MVMPTNLIAPTARLRTCQQIMDFGGTTGTSDIPMFTISGGPVRVEMFVGYVTQQIAATGAVSIFHEFTCDIFGPTALNTVLVITGDIVTSIYTMTGNVGNALVAGTAGLCITPSFLTNPWILGTGLIHLDILDGGGGSDIDGIIEWSFVYEPLAPESMVTLT